VDNLTDGVDIATAARRLGISTDGVHKRIARGRLPVYRVDGRTFVVVDSPSTPTDTPRSTDSLDGHVQAASVHAPEQDTQLGLSNPLVAQLESEVCFLRKQVEALQERHAAAVVAWQERLREAHVLLAQRPALPAPPTAADPAAEATTAFCSSAAAPWWARWAWWRRTWGARP